MPAPTAYSESQLAVFLIEELSEVGAALGWTTATPQIARAIYATARAQGVTDVASVTDMAALEATARREAWAAAVKALAARFTFASDGQTFQRAQLQEMALKAFALAEADARRYSDEFRVIITPITYSTDPYGVIAEAV